MSLVIIKYLIGFLALNKLLPLSEFCDHNLNQSFLSRYCTRFKELPRHNKNCHWIWFVTLHWLKQHQRQSRIFLAAKRFFGGMLPCCLQVEGGWVSIFSNLLLNEREKLKLLKCLLLQLVDLKVVLKLDA